MKNKLLITAFSALLINCFCQIKIMAQTTSNPLFHIEDMVYKGAFYIPGDTHGESNSNYTSGIIEYNCENNSLFLAGFNLHGAIGEFAIPEIVNSSDLTELNTATNLQNFRRILNLTPDGNPQGIDRISGMKLIDGKLVVNAIEYYDAAATNTNTTLVIENPSDIANSSINGYYSLEGAAHAGDWISPIPDEWQELLGGTYLSGSSNKWAINSRCTMGISAFIFDFIQESIIPTTALLDFNLSNPLYADYDTYASANYNLIERNGETFPGHTFEDADAIVGLNDLWTEESQVSYGFIIPGTRTYLTIGASGGHNSGIGYKATQNNGNECGGPCAYDADDYYNYYWLWDVNDLLAVKNNTLMPYEVRPYEYGIFNAPFQTDLLLNQSEFHPIVGGSYDPETKKLFLTIYDGGSTGTYERAPLIAVYQISNSSTSSYYVSPASNSTDWTAAQNIETPCNVSTAFANAIAGDTVLFRGGTYTVPQRNIGNWLSGYYNPSNSGTQQHPIVFMAYPGEVPLFNGTSGGSADCDGHGYYDFATIFGINDYKAGGSNNFKEYIVYDGFSFQADNGTAEARVSLARGDNSYSGQRGRGIVIKNCVFNGGTNINPPHSEGGTGDNREGLFISQLTGLVVSNCKFFDYNHTENNHNTSAIKTYHSDHVIITNCEVYGCALGIYSKSNTDKLVLRYSYIHNNNTGFFTGASGWWNDSNDHTKGYFLIENSDNIIYHNIFANNIRGSISGFAQDGGNLDGTIVYNNTIYAVTGFTASVGLGSGERQHYYNNIQYGPKIDNDIGLLKWSCGNNDPVAVAEGKPEFTFGLESADHNQYGDIPENLLIRIKEPNESTISYTSLGAWQASGTLIGGQNPGEGSMASNPMFVNTSGSMSTVEDFTLQESSPCKSRGRNGEDIGANASLVGIQDNIIQSNYYLSDFVLPTGSSECFNALDTIIVSGDGNTVVIESGSSSTFISGASIRFLEGFHALAGSNVNAYITTDYSFCNSGSSSPVLNNMIEEKSLFIENNEKSLNDISIKVFPNPNNGNFTIKVEGYNQPAQIVIYNSLGTIVYKDIINAEGIVNINNVPRGLYFVKTNINNQLLTQKILIK